MYLVYSYIIHVDPTHHVLISSYSQQTTDETNLFQRPFGLVYKQVGFLCTTKHNSITLKMTNGKMTNVNL